MKTGNLDKIIDLQSPLVTNNAGEKTTTWHAEGQVWAHILSQKGSEAFEAARTTARQVLRVCIRYRHDVKMDWRFLWADQAYEITEIDRTGARRGELWLTGRLVGAK